MVCVMQVSAVIIILSAVWFRALGKMTANLTAFWGTAGVLMAVLSIVVRRSLRIAALDAGEKKALCFFIIMISAGGFIASLCFSDRVMKKQELAIRRTLSLQENDQISARLDEMNEKDSICN